MSKSLAAKDTTIAATPVSNFLAVTGLAQEDIAALDYSTVPVIVNDGEVFKVRGAAWNLSAGHFECIPLVGEEYQYYKCSNETHALPGVYVVNGKTRNGEDIKIVTDIWEEDGCTYQVSEYVGIRVLMTSPDEAKNALAIVTVSPTSVKRFKAFEALEIQRQRRLKPWQSVIKVKLADKPARGRGNKMFYPTEFEFVRELTQEEVDDLNGN